MAALKSDLVYVGVSAGSMAVCRTIGETYSQPRGGSGTPLTTESIVFKTCEGEVSRSFVTARGAALADFAVIPHFENPDHPDACGPNAAEWAGRIPAQVYTIDEQSAIKVVGRQVEVVSEGRWKLFNKEKS